MTSFRTVKSCIHYMLDIVKSRSSRFVGEFLFNRSRYPFLPVLNDSTIHDKSIHFWIDSWTCKLLTRPHQRMICVVHAGYAVMTFSNCVQHLSLLPACHKSDTNQTCSHGTFMKCSCLLES